MGVDARWRSIMHKVTLLVVIKSLLLEGCGGRQAHALHLLVQKNCRELGAVLLCVDFGLGGEILLWVDCANC